MKIYEQPGNIVDLTAAADIDSGDGVIIGSIFGVAVADIASGAKGAFLIEGVVDLPKRGDFSVSEGDKLDWDAGLGHVVPDGDATSEMAIGLAVEDVDSAVTTVKVKLVPAMA